MLEAILGIIIIGLKMELQVGITKMSYLIFKEWKQAMVFNLSFEGAKDHYKFHEEREITRYMKPL